MSVVLPDPGPPVSTMNRLIPGGSVGVQAGMKELLTSVRWVRGGQARRRQRAPRAKGTQGEAPGSGLKAC
jgi:hypothetical protein